MDAQNILVTDFDGTVTGKDFYELAVHKLLHRGDLAPWTDFMEGRITHFTALKRIFERIQAPEETVVRDVIGNMQPDPKMPQAVADLAKAGWRVVVASAGSTWYIDRILSGLGLDLEVHSNPGTYRENGPLVMEPPLDSPFYSPETGVDKKAIVQFYQHKGVQVAFAGDGYTDEAAALQVRPELRFARAALAHQLEQRNEAFKPFSVWSDIARELIGMQGIK